MVDLNTGQDLSKMGRLSLAPVDPAIERPRARNTFIGVSLRDEREVAEKISSPLAMLLATGSNLTEQIKDRETSVNIQNLHILLDRGFQANEEDLEELREEFQQGTNNAPDADEFVRSLSDPNNTSHSATLYRSGGLSLNGNAPTQFDGSAISAIGIVLQKEGLFSNHRADPGGATMMGIASASWPRDFQNIMQINRTQGVEAARAYAIDFYERNFWNPVDRMVEQRFGNLPEDQQQALKLVAFDAAVNGGMGLANRLLNRSGGDVETFMHARIEHLQGLRTWGTFGEGWTNRVNSIGSQAMSFMNGNGGSPTLVRRHDNDDDRLPVRHTQPRHTVAHNDDGYIQTAVNAVSSFFGFGPRNPGAGPS